MLEKYNIVALNLYFFLISFNICGQPVLIMQANPKNVLAVRHKLKKYNWGFQM